MSLASALLGLWRSADASTNLRIAVRAPEDEWPRELPLTTERPEPLPMRQFRNPAEKPGWNMEQHRWRRDWTDNVDRFSGTLKDLLVDDKTDDKGSSDGPFWADVTSMGAVPDSGAFWASVCSGTHEFGQRRKTVVKRPLDGWDIEANMTCDKSAVMEGEYASEKEAELNCGSSCASVIDVGCKRKRFRLCSMGGIEEASTDSTCLRRRFPEHRPPQGKPQAPIEDEFWKAFCTEAGVRFRELFDGRLCAAGKALEAARSEGRCAELAVADEKCSSVFDFKDATASAPPVCRCVPKGEKCAPPPTLAEGTSGGVYIIVTD